MVGVREQALPEGRIAEPALKGEIPSPLHPPAGCHFHPRCPHAMPVCREGRPPLLPVGPGHTSACRLNEVAAAAE